MGNEFEIGDRPIEPPHPTTHANSRWDCGELLIVNCQLSIVFMSSLITISLANTAATQAFGKRLGECLPTGSTLLLEGELGAGKTTLVQGLGEGLGITDAIVSPTFTLINEYPEGRIPLYHFDLYRLDPTETQGLQPELYWEGMEVEPGIVAIEWAQRLLYRPSRYLEIHLIHQGEKRQVQLQGVGGFEINLDGNDSF